MGLIGLIGAPEAADEYYCIISLLLHRLVEERTLIRLLAGSATSDYLSSDLGL
jgi:hypothetical protein